MECGRKGQQGVNEDLRFLTWVTDIAFIIERSLLSHREKMVHHVLPNHIILDYHGG